LGQTPKTTAVIPALNEEGTIREVVREALKYVDAVIVVDDGSDDQTSSRARQAGAYVISHIVNRGQLAAILTGFQGALMLGASILVCLDADLQHDPSEIPNLIAEISEDEADLVIGSRVLYSGKKTPTVRRLGIAFFSALFSYFFRVHITDMTSGFRALRSEVFRSLSFSEDQYCSELVVKAAKQGYRVKELPIHVDSRIYGKSRKRDIVFAYKLLRMILRSYF